MLLRIQGVRGTSLRRIVIEFVVLLLIVQAAKSEAFHGCSTANATGVSLGGKVVLMRNDGKILTTGSYCGHGEYSDGLIRFDLCNGKQSTYVTPEGERVVTVDAEQAKDFGEGLAAVQNEKGQWGYIDKSGHFVIAPRFEEADKFSEGVAPVKLKDDWQYIDVKGNTVIKLQRSNRTVDQAKPFKSGAAFVVLVDSTGNNYEKGLIDHSGKWLLTPTMRLTGELDNGMAPLWEDSTHTMGFINSSGQMVIPPQFTGNAMLPFQEGLAAVYVGSGKAMRAGFIDKKGHWAIPPKYQDGYHFCGGLAPVKMNDVWGFINKKGKFVIPPKFESAESFEDGIAMVSNKDDSGVLHEELINRQGSVLFHDPREAKIFKLH